MTCPICNKKSKGTCLCGFCFDCIKEFGHDGCSDKLNEIEWKKRNKCQKKYHN